MILIIINFFNISKLIVDYMLILLYIYNYENCEKL